jgi:hypothetical protein
MKTLLARACLAVFCLTLALPAQGSPKQLKALTPIEIEKITAAQPEKAAKPAKERKILVFWLCQGFYHDALRYINAALEASGKRTGAFSVTTSDDMNAFEYANLSQYDGVVFNNSTMLKFENTNHRAALIRFVKEDGKGAIGLHAGLDNFYTFPEAAEMMGGIFDAHPWNAGGTWVIRNELPAHPLNRAFSGAGFSIKDELYQFKTPYSRDLVKVLLSIDMRFESNRSGPSFNPEMVRRMDEDFAVSWLRTYGKGRVFYCGIGHNPEHSWNKAIQQHYLDGIQYALGDLAADAAPIPRPKRDIADEYTNLEKLAEDGLLAKLASTKDADIQGDVCRVLKGKATCKSVPALSALLANEKVSHLARVALEPLACPEAGKALRDALAKGPAKLKAGMVSSLAARRDAAATALLIPLVQGSDPALARLALAALGSIGGTEAAAKIAGAKAATADRMDALLSSAESLEAATNRAAAAAIYQQLLAPGASTMARIAAGRGILKADPANAMKALTAMLADADPEVATCGAMFVAELKEKGAGAHFAAQLPKLKPALQVVLLASLATLGDKSVGDAVAALLTAEAEETAVAASKALLSLGGVAHVKALARAAGGSGARADAALETVSRIPGKEIDDELIKLLKDADKAVVNAAEKCLGKRQVRAAVPVLLELAKTKDRAIQKELWKALLALADERELSSLIGLLREYEGDERVRDVVAGVYLRSTNRAAHAPLFLKAHSGAQGGFKLALLPLLAIMGGAQELGAVSSALKDSDPEAPMAALRALGEWPNDSAVEALWGVVQAPAKPEYKILALRGYARLLSLPSPTRKPAETLGLLKSAMDAAEREEEKRQVLAGIAKVFHPDALTLLKSYASDKALGKEADLAWQKMKKAMDSPPAFSASHNERNAKKAMDKDLASRWDTGTKQVPGMWFMADFRFERAIENVSLDAGSSAGDFPNAYEVYVSNNTNDWGPPVAKGEGKRGQPIIPLKNARGQYLKIVQTGSTPNMYWSIHEFAINVAP